MLGGWSRSQEAVERVHVYESVGVSLCVRGAEATPWQPEDLAWPAAC